MVRYHVNTPQGIIIRTSRRQLELGRYTHVVTYPYGRRPTFHFSEKAANQATVSYLNNIQKPIITIIGDGDFTA